MHCDNLCNSPFLFYVTWCASNAVLLIAVSQVKSLCTPRHLHYDYLSTVVVTHEQPLPNKAKDSFSNAVLVQPLGAVRSFLSCTVDIHSNVNVG